MTITFSLDLLVSSRSRGRVVGLGLWLTDVAGEADSLEGGRDDVVEDGVAGRPVGFAGGGGWAGDLRERKGEMEDLRGPLEADILEDGERKGSEFFSFLVFRERRREGRGLF